MDAAASAPPLLNEGALSSEYAWLQCWTECGLACGGLSGGAVHNVTWRCVCVWPEGTSRLLQCAVLIGARGESIQVVGGRLPKSVVAATLLPFIEESRCPCASHRVHSERAAWLRFTDGNGDPFYSVAWPVDDFQYLVLCSAHPAFECMERLAESIYHSALSAPEPDNPQHSQQINEAIEQAFRIPSIERGLFMSIGFDEKESISDSIFAWPLSLPHPIDFPVTEALSYLSATQLVHLWNALVFEQPVILVSLSPNTLTRVAVGLCSLLHPLKMAHPCIPLTPLALAEIMEAPFP